MILVDYRRFTVDLPSLYSRLSSIYRAKLFLILPIFPKVRLSGVKLYQNTSKNYTRLIPKESRHIYYVNFNTSKVQPFKMNMIRNPVERFISHFNFRRNGDTKSKASKTSDYDIDECILNNYKECDAAHASYMIPFFCGQGWRFSKEFKKF